MGAIMTSRLVLSATGLALALQFAPGISHADHVRQLEEAAIDEVSSARRLHMHRYRSARRHWKSRRSVARYRFKRTRQAVWLRGDRSTTHGRRTARPLRSRTLVGYARSLARGPSVSTAGLPRPLVTVIARVQSRCPGFRVISAFRIGARVRGSGRLSLHALHRAADIAGGNYRCAYGVLAGFPGGVTTDAWRVKHIHLSWHPGGREWGLRFAHGGQRRYARQQRRYAMVR